MKTTHSKPIYTEEEQPPCCRIIRTVLPPALSFLPRPPPRGSHPLRHCELPHCDGCSGCIFIPPFPHQFDNDLVTFYHYGAFEMQALITHRLAGCSIGQHPSEQERTPHSDINVSALFNQTNTAFRECYDSELESYNGPRPAHNLQSIWNRPHTHSTTTIFPVSPQLQELLDMPHRYFTPDTSTLKIETGTLSPTAITSLIHQHKRFCNAGTLISEHSTPNHHHPHSQFSPSSSLHPSADTASTIPTQHLHTNSNSLPIPTTPPTHQPHPMVVLSTPFPPHQPSTHAWPSASNIETTPAPTDRLL
jgi:hypothetical protein